ncbi:MAG: PilZ domain-containing protein [Deltaproteobacteria bacterium]|nr:PilZ domain-containing protein [Deltaproteobacteria bacterium]
MSDAKQAVRAWKARARWLDEHRRHLRWLDRRLALVRSRQRELPGVTQDISQGGLQVAVIGSGLAAGEPLRVELAFEERTLTALGRVAYVRPTDWGSVVGVQFARDEERQRFLLERYARPLRPEEG